jgi:hypothetical protein
MRWAGHVARMGEERKVYKVLVGKPEGKSPLGRPRRRWEDGIRMDLKGHWLGGCGLDWTGSGQGPMAGCCECGDESSGSCATELVSLCCLELLCCTAVFINLVADLRTSLLTERTENSCFAYTWWFVKTNVKQTVFDLTRKMSEYWNSLQLLIKYLTQQALTSADCVGLV